MAAQLDVLTVGYVGNRVAGTVVLVRDGEFVVVIDPGMVASRDRILGPLRERGIAPGAVTDVVFRHHHPDHTLNAALFPAARYHDILAMYRDDVWTNRRFDDAGLSQVTPSIRLLLTWATPRRMCRRSSRPPTAPWSAHISGGTRTARRTTRTHPTARCSVPPGSGYSHGNRP